MKERLLAIAMKYAPQGIKIRWKRGKRLVPAWAELNDASMLVPRPRTREALYIFLHECAHFHLKHFVRSDAPSAALRLAYTGNGHLSMAHEEYEAEQWAIAVMRMEGLKVPKRMLREAKDYVFACLKDTSPRHHPDATTPRFVEAWTV